MIDIEKEAAKIADAFAGASNHSCLCDDCKHGRKIGKREVKRLYRRVAAEALEEAAKECDAVALQQTVISGFGVKAAKECATAIRSRKEREGR